MVATKKLRRYFLAHSIVVQTDQPLKHVLFSPDLAGRMTKWSIELSELDITFDARKVVKSQMFADFLEEFTPPTSEPFQNGMCSLMDPPTVEAEGRASSSKALRDWSSSYPSGLDFRQLTTRKSTKP